MSVSSNSPLGSQATGNKSNQLLAVLSADNGAGNQSGPNFSQMLKDKSISPAPAPAPAPAPPPRVESKPTPATKSEPANHAEPAPKATDDTSPAVSTPAPESSASRAVASDEATSKALASKAVALDEKLADAATSKVAKDGNPLARDKILHQRKALGQIDASDLETAKSIKPLPADAENPAVPGPTPVPVAVDQRRPLAEDVVPDAGAAAVQSLASLMPSVAQAVFRQDSRAQADGTGKPEAKSGVPTSTEERAKVLSAKAQDMAALTIADAPPTDQAPKDLSALNPDLSRTLLGDKTQSGKAPSFSSVMQATHSAAGPLAAPLNAIASPSAAPGAAVHMTSDLQAPEFAPEMAARLTVLAGQGVQKAELHLNPAEMGPVSVKIALDGQDAQVQFHAQHALTREVLERSLPELAAALRDAGLTLSGGGVFQQPQDAKPDGQAQRSSVSGQSRDFGPDIGGSDLTPVTVRHTQVGVLDMYA